MFAHEIWVQKKALNYLGLDSGNKIQCDATEPIIWLRSEKLPFDGECLADSVFDNTEILFAHCNWVRCPRMIINRNVKQHDVA